MKILLHLGTWKTGSSAIQITLRRQAEALARHGVVIPRYALAEHGTHAIADAARAGPERLAPLIGDIRATAAAHPDATVVVSSEHLWPLGPGHVRRLCEALAEVSDDVEVLMYLRPQDDLWASIYAQCARMLSVRAHHPRWGTADYTGKRLAGAFDFHAALRPWARALGDDRIRLRLYDRRQFPEGDGVRDFLAIATPPGVEPFAPEGKDLHRSLGWKGVALAIACNDRLRAQVARPAPALLERHRRAVMRTVNAMAEREADTGAGLGWYGKAPSIFDGAERAAVRAHYARANKRLFERFFGGEDIFPEPPDSQRDPLSLFSMPDGEREEALAVLLSHLEERRPRRAAARRPQPAVAAA